MAWQRYCLLTLMTGNLDMIRFKNAQGLEFTSNPQVNDKAAIVYSDGLRVGYVVPHYEPSRGRCYRVYDNESRCHADCGQFGWTFNVIKGLADKKES